MSWNIVLLLFWWYFPPFIVFKIILFIFWLSGSSLLRGLFSSWASEGYFSLLCAGVSLWWLPLLQSRGSVVVARRLQSTGSVAVAHRVSFSAAYGTLPHQGSNTCLLHWQVDSWPLSHQECSPLPPLILETFIQCPLQVRNEWFGRYKDESSAGGKKSSIKEV